MRIVHGAAVTLCLLSLPNVTHAQSLLGRVVDAASGRPLPRAAVGVRVAGDSVVKTLTAIDGAFALPLPAAGKWVVLIQASLAPPVVTDSIEVAPGEVVQRQFLVTMPADPIFYEYQVDQPVGQLPGSSGPRYPAELKRKGTSGEVFVRFVVDTAGRAVLESFQVLRQTHAEFAASVRTALPQLRFAPAERQGRKVAQVVEQPFQFSMGR